MAIKNGMGSKRFALETFLQASFFPALLVTILVLPLGFVFGLVDPAITGAVTGVLIMVGVITLRWDEFAVVVVIAAHLYLDWYLGLRVVGLAMVLVLLLIFFLNRSPRNPWAEPRALWLWALFLLLTIEPAIKGATTIFDTLLYYPNVVVGSFVIFWLGIVVAREIKNIRRLFKMLAGLGTILAVITLIEASSGTLILATTRLDAYIATLTNLQLAYSHVSRAGSYFIGPNWNGTFFATLLFLPLGLFFECRSYLEKVLYLVEMFVMLAAMLSTYSNGAWIGVLGGVLAFVIFVSRIRYRVQIITLVFILAAAILVFFPTQIGLQIDHATAQNEASLRLGAWETGVNVIRANPLFGIGMGTQAYYIRAEPYRSLLQSTPLEQPHNSYLEWAAMAGIPVLIVFVALVFVAFCLAIRNWILADRQTRSLLAGGIACVMALSVNSLTINGWTLPPIGAIGWLVLGAISSPLIKKFLTHGAATDREGDAIDSLRKSSLLEKSNQEKVSSFSS